MKKLKIKVFVTLLIIFTLINISFLVISNISVYNNIKSEVEEALLTKVFKQGRLLEPHSYNLSKSNGVFEIAKTKDDEFIRDSFKKEMNKINSQRNLPGLYIGNLYKDEYSYMFKGNEIQIIDNTQFAGFLKKALINSIILSVVLEFIIILISHLLTRWMVRPAEKAFEDQNKFIEDASHELKTPLAVIMASLDIYEKDGDEKWIKNVKSESLRMNDMVKELLDLSQLQNDIEIKYESDFVDINLSNIFESQILTCESLFYESEIDLKYDLEKDISYRCNESQMKQLIHILLDNSIKHSKDISEADKRNVYVKFYKKKEDNKIILEVTNKGMPLSKDETDKIFDRFYKKDASRNREDNNYGLGLAIAKSIVQRHKGEITCYSTGEYVTFKVEL